ncbi:hypothetical protein HYV80_03885 [Candidatus Woesearchaeota archaeon]|nr:hypothetical protein [Candidatus Woesearchaeota archaeon]
MDPEKKRVGKISNHANLENAFIGLSILLGIIVLANVVITANLNKEMKAGSAAAQEKLKPAKIELIIVKNSKCRDCFDISAVMDYVKSANVEAAKESSFEFDSSEGKKLISKYGIGKVPSLIVTGEIDKINLEMLEQSQDALVFRQAIPPFTDAASGKIEGLVSLSYIKDSKCADCADLALLISQIKAAGIKIVDEKTFEAGSSQGNDLLKRYNLGFVPTIILSKDAESYSIMEQAWFQIGTKENDGSYVMRVPSPPFMNLTSKVLRGIVDITYITDNSCPDCYNVSQHREILANEQGFAVRLGREEYIDISDAKGKELIFKYNITHVPTIVVSDELGVYPSSQALKQFFSAEKDGSYVFRLLSAVGTYKDLEKNEIVKAQQAEVQ